jgi:hypothetical protein
MSIEPQSTGLFAVWQPRYAAVGLPIFPLAGKKPLIRGYLRVGLRASAELARKFPDSTSFGLALGWRTAITVLDIDSPDEQQLKAAIAKFGDTPFLVRSGRGHFQAWYRHNGEGRRIRPIPDLPIDILGKGLVVVAPSVGALAPYEIIKGRLDDLRRLPAMRYSHPEPGGRRLERPIRPGGRNKALFRFALLQAHYVDDEEALLDVVQTENQNACVPSLPDVEVREIVCSAWRYQTEGRNLVGEKFVAATDEEVDELAAAFPDAFALLLRLRRLHRSRAEFVLGKATAKHLDWTLPRFRAARARLEERGYIRCIHRGGLGMHDPPIYALSGTKSRLNRKLTPSFSGDEEAWD